jgi:hypothetical protein
LPSLRLSQPHSIRRLLLSAFFADSIQQIHSLRASGVMSSHAASTCGSDRRASRKSAGTLCTTPAIGFLARFFGKLKRRPPADLRHIRTYAGKPRLLVTGKLKYMTRIHPDRVLPSSGLA